MTKEIYEEIYNFTCKIYDAYQIEDKNLLNKIIELEEPLYDRIFTELDDYNLNVFLEYAIFKYSSINPHDYDLYEAILYEDKNKFVIRRINNKLLKKSIEYNITDENKQAITLNDQITLVSSNIYDASIELNEKIIANIEAKFIYMLEKENIINRDEIIKKLTFVSVYLEEIVKNKAIEEIIKEEDNLYNNLWEHVKNDYMYMLNEYVTKTIGKNIIFMHSKIDLNNPNNIKVREIYLRTLFNYLDIKEIDLIKKQYEKEDLVVYNKEGYKAVIESFESYDKDKELIKKIKTH